LQALIVPFDDGMAALRDAGDHDEQQRCDRDELSDVHVPSVFVRFSGLGCTRRRGCGARAAVAPWDLVDADQLTIRL